MTRQDREKTGTDKTVLEQGNVCREITQAHQRELLLASEPCRRQYVQEKEQGLQPKGKSLIFWPQEGFQSLVREAATQLSIFPFKGSRGYPPKKGQNFHICLRSWPRWLTAGQQGIAMGNLHLLEQPLDCHLPSLLCLSSGGLEQSQSSEPDLIYARISRIISVEKFLVCGEISDFCKEFE